ncbi:MAG: citrate synthase, partial [Butyrivibrio sp.]|nr:citrate synthase [Butyrivibrio sp.]
MKNFLNEYAESHATYCIENTRISPRLYEEYGVNLGLRDDKGVGVLTGLTGISKIVSSKVVNGKKVPCEGELWYRGYRIEDLIDAIAPEEYGFERLAYLLIMGKLPSEKELGDFFS